MPERDVEGERSLSDARPQRASQGLELEEMVLAELVSRVLDRGVVIAGDVTISVAGIDLVHLALRLRVSSTETLRQHRLRRESAGTPDAPPDRKAP